MIIPFEQLTEDVLDNIIESFVLTEGTEYGMEDISLSEKIAQVHQQLVQGKAVIVYSELHETVNIMQADQFKE